MKQQLTPDFREVLRQYKIGTPVMSQEGEWIGHVIGFEFQEREMYASAEDWASGKSTWDTEGRFVYQVKVRWMGGEEDTRDIGDIKII